MPMSDNVKDALRSADDWLRQVTSVPRDQDKAMLLQRTQIMLLRSILVELSEMRQEAHEARNA